MLGDALALMELDGLVLELGDWLALTELDGLVLALTLALTEELTLRLGDALTELDGLVLADGLRLIDALALALGEVSAPNETGGPISDW